ncbi:MAG: Ig-like domain-containing protein, partial [Gemmatimonadota bacterium]
MRSLGWSRSSRILAAVVPAVVLAACGGSESSGPPKVASIGVTALATQLEIGQTAQLTASPRDSKGNPLTGKTVTWTSSAAAVASVDNAGIVSGVTAGTATISAAADGVTGSIAITVVPIPVSGVYIDNRTPSVRQGGTAQLTAVAQDALGRVLADRTINWSSATPAIASVSQTGLVTGLSAGTTYIRALVEGKVDSVPMRVRSLNAPTITGVSPATWTPAGQATISGTNFAPDLASNDVFVNGTRATVTAASATSLSITLPPITALACAPTGPVPLVVSVNGDSATAQASIAMATPRQLAVGESMLLTSPSDLLCNEFSATGGTYVVTAFNYGTSAAAAASFQLFGAARATAASTLLAPAKVLAFPAPSAPAFGPLALAAPSRDERIAIGRAASLNAGIAYLNSHPNIRRAMAAKKARERAAYSRTAAPGAFASVTPVDPPAVGDWFTKRMMRTFGTYTTFDTLRARVVYVGPKLIIMEDSLAPLAGTMDNEYQAIGTEFDRDMFGYLANFGDPLVLDSETDNNGRVI